MIAHYVKQLTLYIMDKNLDPKTLIIIVLIAIIAAIFIRRLIFRVVNRLLRKIL